MKIRMIEDFGRFKKMETHDLNSEIAKVLISKGYALLVKESTKDKSATNALLEARQRDNNNQ